MNNGESGVNLKDSSSAFEVKTNSKGLVLNPWAFGAANLMITLCISFLLWYLLIDPKVSLTKLYPQPFGLFLFWSILAAVFLAFCWEMWPLNKLTQPLKGIVSLLVGSAIALIAILLIGFGYGSMDTAFTLRGGISAPGYTASGMIVLIGFYMWGMLGGNWGHWPWSDLKLEQPVVGLAEFMFGLSLTLIAYLVLIYPNVAVWATQDNVVLPLTIVVGWYYSVIVSCFMTANILDNWPWVSLFHSRWSQAIGSFFGNFILGTGIYWFFLFLLKTWLIPAQVQIKLGDGINSWPAQLGVTFVFWVLVWALMFGNYPNTGRPARDRTVRFVITFVLTLVTFVLYTQWFAVGVLHEPAVSGSFGGDALAFMDWLIYVMLIYVVYFESWGLKRR